VLEHVARLASETRRIFTSVEPIAGGIDGEALFPKHGPGAYYGQK